MTAPNPVAVQKCIKSALAGIEADAIDAINGHLTATQRQFRNTELEQWN
jgi:3-oxoacyl-(acyl-carrier-protein) synthase